MSRTIDLLRAHHLTETALHNEIGRLEQELTDTQDKLSETELDFAKAQSEWIAAKHEATNEQMATAYRKGLRQHLDNIDRCTLILEDVLNNPFLTRNTRRKIEEAQKLWITDQDTEDHTDDE
jgi:flagellar biosynthesis/type III secretory pathway protein FliH